jgi:hypothetical protein
MEGKNLGLVPKGDDPVPQISMFKGFSTWRQG